MERIKSWVPERELLMEAIGKTVSAARQALNWTVSKIRELINQSRQ